MTKKLPSYPDSLSKTLSPAAKKLWRPEMAERVPPHLLTHYALACNALAEYRMAQKAISKLEKKEKGSSLLAANTNGNIGIHPLRNLADKARRAFNTEMKNAGLTINADDATAVADEDILA